MDVKKFYEQLGMGYEDVSGRLGSDALIKKFVIRFLDDASFTRLREGLQENDGEKAFRAAHTLKGVCLNLGFDNLFTVSSDLTEKLRAKELEESEELFRKVKEQYAITIAALRELQASL